MTEWNSLYNMNCHTLKSQEKNFILFLDIPLVSNSIIYFEKREPKPTSVWYLRSNFKICVPGRIITRSSDYEIRPSKNETKKRPKSFPLSLHQGLSVIFVALPSGSFCQRNSPRPSTSFQCTRSADVGRSVPARIALRSLLEERWRARMELRINGFYWTDFRSECNLLVSEFAQRVARWMVWRQNEGKSQGWSLARLKFIDDSL